MEEIKEPKQTCPTVDNVLFEIERCLQTVEEMEDSEKPAEDFVDTLRRDLNDAVKYLEDVRTANIGLRDWGHENGRACYDVGVDHGNDKGYEEGYKAANE